MLPRNHPDRIGVSFDDHRLVAQTASREIPASSSQIIGISIWLGFNDTNYVHVGHLVRLDRQAIFMDLDTRAQVEL